MTSGAVFVHCPGCSRLMLGQITSSGVLPQPHECTKERHE